MKSSPLLNLVLAGQLLATVPLMGASPGGRPYQASLTTGSPFFTIDGQGLTFSNEVLAASWTLPPGGFRARFIENTTSRQRLNLTGELFQIVLADGQRYAAARLIPDGKPKIVQLVGDLRAARHSARRPGRKLELPLRSEDGRLRVRWRALARENSAYLCQELEVEALKADCAIKEVIWLEQQIPGARAGGQVDGSPAIAGNFFLGIEDPHALNLVTASGQVSCRLPRNALLKKGASFVQSFVFGVVPPGQMRRGFLNYLERERAHPYRPFLHYNSWYDIAWDPFALNETNSLEAIRLFGERFINPHGVVMDALVFDDGWDNPQTLWHFHQGFPNGFAPLARLCAQYHTHLGVWLSPFGGYGEPKKRRLEFGAAQGYETNATGFSLAGPKYYSAFSQACLGMIRKYGIKYFKFDGIAAGMYARGGADYTLDTEAMRRLMLELRQDEPELFINLTTGSWPSPFWLRFADSLWRQGDDMGHAGKGPTQEQWLTYRDAETYRNIVRQAPLFPLNSLMNQGVSYSRRGLAGDPTFNSAGLKHDIRSYFGNGTGLQELYLQPARLNDQDWQTLAEATKWSRANADVLVDTHWIGGDPRKLEVYGWASWSPRKGIITLRNPNDREQEFFLDLATAFELPPGSAKQYSLKSPWLEDASQSPLVVGAGKPVRLAMPPFEVLVFDATPVQ